MAVARLQPLVLMRRQLRPSRRQRWAGVLVVIVFSAVLVGVMYWLFADLLGDLDRAALAKLLAKLVDHLREAPAGFLFDRVELLALVIVACAQVWYLRRASKHERLFLDETGIRYKSPLPEALGFLHPDWSLQWSQVRGARIVLSRVLVHPNFAVVEFDAAPAKRKLLALQWSTVDSAGETASQDPKLSWRERFFSGTGSARHLERTLRAVEQSEIVRYAKQAGVTVTSSTARGMGSDFALESHRHTLAAALLALSLLVYATIDIALYEESYAVDPPLVLFALAGAIAVLASMFWLALAGVPRVEMLGLSVLLGGAAGLALYPGLLRLNEATDSEGLRAYEYRLTEYVAFSPLDSHLPVLKFSKYGDYWGQFALGTTHRFELRKGALGFYQIDMAPVHAKMRDYFTGRK